MHTFICGFLEMLFIGELRFKIQRIVTFKRVAVFSCAYCFGNGEVRSFALKCKLNQLFLSLPCPSSEISPQSTPRIHLSPSSCHPYSLKQTRLITINQSVLSHRNNTATLYKVIIQVFLCVEKDSDPFSFPPSFQISTP